MEVFLTSPWIPAEWIRAHGLQPRGIWSAGDFQRTAGPISAGVCAFAEATVRFSEVRRDSTVIFSTACDQMRRGFDTAILRGHFQAFLLNLPATWQTATAGHLFRSELERLGRFLLSMGGTAPSPELLRRELLSSCRTRRQLLESAPGSSSRGFAEAVARFHWDGSFSQPPSAAPTTQIRLALLGGPFLASHWALLDEIEAAGGRVVLNATETGERSLLPALEVEAAAEHPFDALVRGYLDNLVDAFQRPNTRLYSWLRPRLADRRVRGIVLWHYTGCDLWRAEEQTLREAFGLPVLLLDAGEEPCPTPREITRLQAFIEMLG